MVSRHRQLRRTRQNQRKAFQRSNHPIDSRTIFQQYLEKWKSDNNSGEWAYVVTMDLARFHTINKRFSYEMGDKVLDYVLDRLRNDSPDGCNWMRLGSDIFIALIIGTLNKNDVDQLIRGWKKKIEEPFIIDGFEFMLTVNFGAASWPTDGADFLQLMKSSDVALREAKDNETSILKWYDPIFRDRIVSAFELEKQIRTAIQQKEFELYYQPQWDVNKKKWGGLEVLVRWRHPSRGLVPPDKFIDIAEVTGLIHPLGDWIIREACEQHVQRQKETVCANMPLAINFSIKQLMTPNFLDNLLEIIHSTGMKPEHFMMELTESIAIDVEKAKAMLTRAKSYGIKISIDDFGTGYSSLSYFLDLPIDELKIDRSFILNGLIGEEKKKRLLQWIVQLGKVLEVDVVAEGVETKEQYELLRGWGCDKLQGYYFSKPISSDKIQKFLEEICYD